MKNKGAGVHILSSVLLLVTIAITTYAVVYLSQQTRRNWRDTEKRRIRIKIGEKLVPSARINQKLRVYESYDSLLVRNLSGRIEVKGSDNDYTLVSYTKRGPFEKELEVITEVRNGTLTVRPDYRERNRTPFTPVSFDILVPRDIGSIQAESVSGSIEILGLGGSVDQELKTVSGRIQTDGAGNLSASTTSGSIRFRFYGSTLSVRTVSGSVHGDIVAFEPGGRGELSTVSGSVRLNAYEGLDAKIEMKSESGYVACGFPLQKSQGKRNKLSGTIGSGLSLLTVKTTSGSIRLGKS